MQIVIDIPDDVYKRALVYKDVQLASNRANDLSELITAVANGTPLPKGHGDLIDRGQTLKECYDIPIDGDVFKVVQYETLLGVPTLIEADK